MSHLADFGVFGAGGGAEPPLFPLLAFLVAYRGVRGGAELALPYGAAFKARAAAACPCRACPRARACR